MIDWSSLDRHLDRLAATAPAARLLSIETDLAAWPRLRTEYDWCAWIRADQQVRLLGLGTALESTSMGEGRFAALQATQRGLAGHWHFSGHGSPRGFIGFAFDPHGGAPLPAARLWVPELLLMQGPAGITLTFSCPAHQARTALTRWKALWAKSLVKKTAKPAHTSPFPTPFFSALPHPASSAVLADPTFLTRGQAALTAIARNEVSKLVLTRSARFHLSTPPDPVVLLDGLARGHANCATFGIGIAEGSFIGASPETLLRLQDETIAVDALAGTAWQAGARPLDDDKNRREHDCVARAVSAALADICHDIHVPLTPEIMALDHGLTHLRRRVTARRNPGQGLFDLLARLHPTPAVGGTPTPAALAWLAAHGDNRPAWYTGGIGWFDALGNADIAVALRCGWFSGQTAILHAGAGFVAGSEPAQELAETEAKLAAMLDALSPWLRLSQIRAA